MADWAYDVLIEMEKPACYVDSSESAEEACVIADGSVVRSAGAAVRSRRFSRLLGLAVAVCCTGAICLAFWLSPRAGGVGTHRQLGLPSCSFLERTGYPCPTCGFTTSVSAMAHGRFVLAAESHPFGAVFFIALVVFGVCAWVQVLTGRSILARLGRPAWWACAFVIGIPAGWAMKLIWGIIDGTLPVR